MQSPPSYSDSTVRREETLAPATGRVAWVDVSRVLVMLGTVLTHAPVPRAWQESLWFTSAGRMCLLFAFAGYFMGRRCPPGVLFPQKGRALRMLAAYVVLVVIYVVCLGWTPYWTWQDLTPLLDGSWPDRLDLARRLFGMGDYPPGPLWFLRDLFLLTMACSFFAFLGRRSLLWPLVAVGLLFGMETACHRFEIAGVQVIHPREIAFFALGCAMTNVSLARIGAWVRRWSLPIVALALFLLWFEPRHWVLLTPVGIAAYMGLSMSLALWLERLAPKVARFIARLGETVFFVYVLHMLVIDLFLYGLQKMGGIAPGSLSPWMWILIVPAIYVLIHLLGVSIRRLSPRLFEILAIRPPKRKEDIPSSGAGWLAFLFPFFLRKEMPARDK